MKFALSLGVLNPSAWVMVTEEADRLGFDSVWMPEHLVLPVGMGGSPHDGQDHPPIPPGTPVYDPLVYLAFLAARTERIRFGTQVYNIGLRHPFSTARAVATLDLLSQGRLDLGIGASWLRAEWEAVGLDFDSRGARVDEIIDICQRLWSDEVVEYRGRFFDFDPVMFEPKPVQKPWPRLHIGGDGPAALRRAATVGDGWVPMNHALEDVPAAVARMAELRERADRPGRTEVTLGAVIERPEDVERYAEAGVDRVFVRPWRRTSEAMESISRFAEEFIPR
ncbi:MAG: LLM class F420-dependent oxidoreductase [Acidimicrobiales bacterium]